MLIAEQVVTAGGLADRIGDTRSESIRRVLTELIEAGELPPGTRLPTVRDLAAALGTSVGAVADAWAELGRLGLLDTRRRGGTTVAEAPASVPAPPRSRAIDLTHGRPDEAFLPDLSAALVAAGAQSAAARTAGRAAGAVPELRSAVQRLVPFSDAEVLAAPGMHAAMHLVVSALVSPGDVVAIEEPTCVRNTLLLRDAEARIVTLASDAEGPRPDSLAAALAADPAVIAFQPAAAVPLGSTLTPRRRAELVAVLRASSARPWIVEEDMAGPLASGLSLGEAFPDRVVRVVHLARALGGQLQTAVIAGTRTAIDVIADRQQRTGVGAPALVQRAVAHLLDDPETTRTTDAAAAAYRDRNAAIIRALRAEGVAAEGAGGFFAWIPVADERDALLALAEHGIAATPGSRSTFGGLAPHVRIGTTRLPDTPADITRLARAIAVAAAHRFTSEDE